MAATSVLAGIKYSGWPEPTHPENKLYHVAYGITPTKEFDDANGGYYELFPVALPNGEQIFHDSMFMYREPDWEGLFREFGYEEERIPDLVKEQEEREIQTFGFVVKASLGLKWKE